MSRRFLFAERSSDFKVYVNNKSLPADSDQEQVEYSFPKDYLDGEKPAGLTITPEGWGIEEIGNSRAIRWKLIFYEDTIKEDELRGVSIFANGKLAQRPFLFNIVGGISGQQGLEYLSGKVEADYIDALSTDIIATERQRINWEDQNALPLLDWGKKRIIELCRIWKQRRAQEKLDAMEKQIQPFAQRLSHLQTSEQKTVRGALLKLAQISSLTSRQFQDLGEAILTSWEAGRLKELVHEVAQAPEMSSDKLVELLIEANVLTALNTYEAVKTKLTIIEELRKLVEKNEIENKVRDYIAKSPWLISSRWETFKIEISLKKLLDQVAAQKGINPEKEWNRRIDLVLASGDAVLILEFMQPGKKIDRDHISRFQYYVNVVRQHFAANSALGYKICTGYLIASKLPSDSAILSIIQEELDHQRYYMDWDTLLAQSERQYEDFIQILKERSPDDSRLKRL